MALDDALMGVNQVVRGRDILYSTPKQLLLLKLLQLPFPQEYAHIPLLLDEHSERLAKRHQSLSLKQLRACGVRPTRIIGVLAYLAALIPKIEDVTPAELLTHFDYSLLPKHDRMLSPDLLSCLQS